jgi:pimeloyl-ACP methyl ester carboxylesterase
MSFQQPIGCRPDAALPGQASARFLTKGIDMRIGDRKVASVLVLAGLFAGAPVRAQAPPAYGPDLEAFAYPYPVHSFAFTSQGRPVSMAYLDVAPATPNGRTAVLLHGKNFCAATWETTIKALVDHGFRVIAVDQIGFCKSTKPEGYQFTFQQLAENTHALLQSLGFDKVSMIGHSTGGMLAIRYALMYGQELEKLVLVDPIGLEDWKAAGVPALSIDQWTEREMKTSVESMQAYEQASYYAGTWKPDYQRWVEMYAGMFAGAGLPLMAHVTARIDDMIYTQPVVYELGQIAVPTLLIIGDKDRTAIGKDLVPPALRERLGNYPELGKAAARAIPGARLVEFPDYGHAPWVQDPDAVNQAILGGL